VSDHYHDGEYAEARHDHRGEYADDRHDHGTDYAEKHHRHYDDERALEDLQRQLGELRDDLRGAVERIRRLEERSSELPPCSCPKKSGMIRHQRSSCTDPIVARLDWYADDGGRP
jgi:hypothetical protein